MIQIIRNKLGPAIVIIIGLSLGLFVLQTALNSNTGLLGGKGDSVGSIDGKKINIREFQAKVDTSVEAYKINSNSKNLDDNTIFTLRDQTWNQMINEYLNQREFDALGITLPKDQMQDLFFGADPYPELKKSFTNPNTGQFDPMAVKNYLDNLDKSVQGEDVAEKQTRWASFQKYVLNDVITGKYKVLLKNAVYVPKWQAEMEYNDKETKYSLQYLKIPLSDIADSTIKVTDGNIQEYINKHKEQYKQDETRKIEYVIFTVQPSASDTAKAFKYVNDSYQHFAASPNDTDYFRRYSDRAYDKMYYSPSKLDSKVLKDTLSKIAVGSVLPVYFEDGSFKTAVLIDRKMMPDSVKASHILFSTQNGTDSIKVKAKADSVFNAIKSGAAFETLASKYSDDKGSGAKGGDLGYIKYGMTVKKFNDYLFEAGKVGEVSMVKTEFGYHIIRITEAPASTPQVQIATVTRHVDYSSATTNSVYDIATKFLNDHSTPELFSKAMQEPNLNKQINEQTKKNDFQIPGLNSAREVVKWSYGAEKDAISSVFTLGDNYAVAHLVSISLEGTGTVEVLRTQIEPLVRNELKGAALAGQVNASVALNATLESLAQKFSKEVGNGDNMAFADGYFNNIGFEPKINGALSSLKEGVISKPIIGRNAVFVLKLTASTKPQPIADYNQYKQQITQAVAPRFEYGFSEALKKTITIVDDRYMFF